MAASDYVRVDVQRTGSTEPPRAVLRSRNVAEGDRASSVKAGFIGVVALILILALMLMQSPISTQGVGPSNMKKTLALGGVGDDNREMIVYVQCSATPQANAHNPLPIGLPSPSRVPTISPSPHPSPSAAAPRSLVLLSTDLHISPIADLKDIITRYFDSIQVIDESLSGSCGSMGTCAKRLQVLLQPRVTENIYASSQLKRQFFEAYKEGGFANDSLVLDTDVIHASHPSGMFEFYMPFNRSLIFWATTRFEQGRERNPDHFRRFVRNVRAIAAQPGNVILANSVYDQHYVHYFTGVMPQYMPSLCAYPVARYSWVPSAYTSVPGGATPRSHTILIQGWRPHPSRIAQLSLAEFLAPVMSALQSRGSSYGFVHIRDYYPGRYEYTDMCAHPALFHIPYQVSVMSLFEQYRMGVPIIAPGPKMLTDWHMRYGMVSERTWDMVLQGIVPKGSIIGKHPDADEAFDPNDDTNPAAVEYWLRFADFYTFPHIITFESWDELAEKLTTIDLNEVSRLMLKESVDLEARLVAQWRDVFSQVIPARDRPSLEGKSYNERMDAIYGAGEWEDYF